MASLVESIRENLTNAYEKLETKGVAISGHRNIENLAGNIDKINPQKVEQEKSVTIETNGTTEVTPDENKTLSKVTVTTDIQPTLQEKTATPAIETQEIVADEGNDGLSKVTIEAVTSTIDSNIVAENIKKDVSILGVTGVYDPQPVLQEQTITITENKTTEITPDSGKVLSKVSVTTNVQPTLQEKTVIPTTAQQTVTADSGKDGLSEVTVEAVTAEIDSNIAAENIKKDVTILGVTGTLEQGGAEAVLGTLNVTSNGTYEAGNALSLEPGGLYEYKKVLPKEVLAELKTKTSNTDLLFCVPSPDLPLTAIFIKEIGGEYVLEQISAEMAISIYATASTNVPIGSNNIAVNAGWNLYVDGNPEALSIETTLIRLPQDFTNVDASFVNLLNKQFDTSSEITMAVDTSKAITITGLGTYYKVTSFPVNITKQNLAIVSLFGYNEFSDLSSSEIAQQAIIILIALRALCTSNALQTDIEGLKYIKDFSGMLGNPLIYIEDATKVQVSSGLVENGCWYASFGEETEMLNGSTWCQEKDLVDGYNKVIVNVDRKIVLQDKAITENGNYTFDEGYDGLGIVNVNIPAPRLQDKTITENGAYTFDDGYDGLGTVTVNFSSITFNPQTMLSVHTATGNHFMSETNYDKVKKLIINEGITKVYRNGDGNNYTKLKEVSLPSTLLSIGKYAFSSAISLTTINIPTNITEIDNYAFRGCNLTGTITLPDTLTKLGDYCFSGNDYLNHINIPNNVSYIGEGALSGTSITEIVIPEGITEIKEGTFQSCTSLSNVVLPEGLIRIGRNAFFNCHVLNNITIPSTVTTIDEYAFRGISTSPKPTFKLLPTTPPV